MQFTANDTKYYASCEQVVGKLWVCLWELCASCMNVLYKSIASQIILVCHIFLSYHYVGKKNTDYRILKTVQKMHIQVKNKSLMLNGRKIFQHSNDGLQKFSRYSEYAPVFSVHMVQNHNCAALQFLWHHMKDYF